MLSEADLAHTPLANLIHPSSTLTHLDAFKAVRQLLRSGHSPIFVNNLYGHYS
jgi:hypothetical protein